MKKFNIKNIITPLRSPFGHLRGAYPPLSISKESSTNRATPSKKVYGWNNATPRHKLKQAGGQEIPLKQVGDVLIAGVNSVVADFSLRQQRGINSAKTDGRCGSSRSKQT